jgi:cyclase
MDVVEWARRGVALGAGEIVLNSVDADGARAGYETRITRWVAETVSVPVVASGGAGTLEHFSQAVLEGKADAVLAASVFHFGTLRICDVKAHLAACGIPVRPG